MLCFYAPLFKLKVLVYYLLLSIRWFLYVNPEITLETELPFPGEYVNQLSVMTIFKSS